MCKGVYISLLYLLILLIPIIGIGWQYNYISKSLKPKYRIRILSQEEYEVLKAFEKLRNTQTVTSIHKTFQEPNIISTKAINPSESPWVLEIDDDFTTDPTSGTTWQFSSSNTNPSWDGSSAVILINGETNGYATMWYNVRELKYRDIMIEVTYYVDYPSASATDIADGFVIAFYKNFRLENQF